MTTVKSTNTRTIVKGLTWRIVSILLTIAIVYFLTGGIEDALKVGAFDFFIKFAVYFGHEKLWKLTEWGKVVVKTGKCAE